MGSLLGTEGLNPLLMTNYLFLYFNLWLLQESKGAVEFKNSDKLYELLLSYVKNKVDVCQLDLEDVASLYPALDFCLAAKLNDCLVLKFLKDLVGSCENTEVLSLTPEHPVPEILPLIRPVFSRIRTVCLAIGGLVLDTKLLANTRSFQQDNKVISISQATSELPEGDIEIAVILNYSASQNDETLLDFVYKSSRPFSLYLVNRNFNLKPMVELSDLIKGNIRKFYIRQAGCFLFANKELDVCPYLTHLSFASSGVQLNRSVFTALCEAAACEKFPNISHLSFSGCKSGIKGKLDLLFSKPWPTLTHFDVTKCDLDENDIEVIFAATHVSRKYCLPQLTSVSISPQLIEIERKVEIFMRPWTTLKSLKIFSVEKGFTIYSKSFTNYTLFCKALTKGIFPNLTEIGLSESIPDLLHGLPQLCSVIIGCALEHDGCIPLDVETLTTALRVENICHLDLSNNKIASNLPHLVCHHFPSLKDLILSNCQLSFIDARSLAQANGGGKFPKLKHLDISMNYCRLCDLFEFKSKWDHVDTLTIGGHHTQWSTDFVTLVTKSQAGCLNRLEKLEVWFYNQSFQSHFCQHCHQYQFERPSDEQVPTHKDVLAPIANNLDKLESSSLKTIYVYSAEYFLPKHDKGVAEKLKIRSKNISVYFIVIPRW